MRSFSLLVYMAERLPSEYLDAEWQWVSSQVEAHRPWLTEGQPHPLLIETPRLAQ